MNLKICTLNLLMCMLIGCSIQEESELITIDVNQNYPEKVIELSEIADITYVQLDESQTDFLFKGVVAGVTDNYIIATDIRSGDVLFFSKEGMPVSKFNRRGNGPEEYKRLGFILYDEKKDELIIQDFNNIRVYTSRGDFLKSYSIPSRTLLNGYAILDDHSLLLFDGLDQFTASAVHQGFMDKAKVEEELRNREDRFQSAFIRFSRDKGVVEEYLGIKEDFFGTDLTGESFGDRNVRVPVRINRFSVHQDGWLLHNQETDTIFLYRRDHSLSPYMTQTPSVREGNPGTFIYSVVDIDNYQFIELHTLRQLASGTLHATGLLRDKKDGSIYKSKVVLNEYEGKNFIVNRQLTFLFQTAHKALISLPVDELWEAYETNKLTGKLKEVVGAMDPESENDLLLLLKFR